MITLNDPYLWGNEAADDEDPQRLSSYFVSQKTFAPFFDPSVRLSIARARKGMGKSALLRECATRVAANPDALVISLKGSDLIAQRPVLPLTPAELLYDWQQRLCMIINRHLGAAIGFATSDDKLLLVETAELSGFRQRSLVGMLLARLKGKLGPISISSLEPSDHSQLLQRVTAHADTTVWLLIDDIDATFLNHPDECLRLAAFFSACRDMASNYSGIKVRACVRTDVWTSIRRLDEALDKCEQYIFDIQWSNRQMGQILAERVSSYLVRSQASAAASQDPERLRLLARGTISPAVAQPPEAGLELLERVFAAPFPWGGGFAAPHRVIHVYSAGRPRWAAQLCRMAGAEAIRVRDTLIKFGHIKQVLEDYGRYRLDDLTREHRHQCEQVSLLTNAFSNQRVRYNTAQLLRFIDERVLPNLAVTIEDTRILESLPIARFLYRIGLFVARGSVPTGGFEYFPFEERPELLRSAANLDDGLIWDVHPSFRAALRLASN